MSRGEAPEGKTREAFGQRKEGGSLQELERLVWEKKPTRHGNVNSTRKGSLTEKFLGLWGGAMSM